MNFSCCLGISIGWATDCFNMLPKVQKQGGYWGVAWLGFYFCVWKE